MITNITIIVNSEINNSDIKRLKEYKNLKTLTVIGANNKQKMMIGLFIPLKIKLILENMDDYLSKDISFDLTDSAKEEQDSNLSELSRLKKEQDEIIKKLLNNISDKIKNKLNLLLKYNKLLYS